MKNQGRFIPDKIDSKWLSKDSNHTGLLKHRPSRYVPVKVSLYNEQGNVQELKLLNSTHPVISRSDDLVEVLFKLMGSEYNRITR